MHFRALVVAVATLSLAGTARAQDGEAPGMVYVASYKIGYQNMAAWTAAHFEYNAPVLDALVDEGVIISWNVWQHHTGSDYNWRLGVRAADWASFDTFWVEFLGRSAEAAGEERTAELWRMVLAHEDEVWNISHLNVESTDSRYVYDSRFHVPFPDMPAWNAMWEEHTIPVLEQAMADGMLGGYVIEQHNTGGHYNWKILYVFEDWDQIDDLLARVIGAVTSDAELWNSLGTMMHSHDDVIWETVPEPEGM